MGEKVFKSVQYGKETVKGTAVAATAVWPGTFKPGSDRKLTTMRRSDGQKGGNSDAEFFGYLIDGAALSLSEGAYQVLPMLFSMSTLGNVTMTEATPGQGDYSGAFTPVLTAPATLDSYTFEWGDNTQWYEAEFGLCRSLKFSGSENGAVSIEASVFARQISKTTKTASLAPKTLTTMLFNMSKIYIDSSWATLGNTQKSNFLRKFDVEILTGLHPKFFANGTMYFGTYGEGDIDVIANFTFEGDSVGVAQWDAYNAKTKQAIRLLIEGPQIGSGTKHKLQLDMWGIYSAAEMLAGDIDGNNVSEFVFEGLNDHASPTPHKLAVTVTTDSSAL